MDSLLDRGVAFTVRYDATGGAPLIAAHPATADGLPRTVGLLHERFGARGAAPRAAYVTVVAPASRALLGVGAAALTDYCSAAGVVYLELAPADDATDENPVSAAEFLAFQQALWREVIARNLAGTLLVEKRLALALEAVRAARDQPAPVEVVVHEADGTPQKRETAPGDATCRTCRHDAHCSAPILRRWLFADHAPKAPGTPHCLRTQGTFDALAAVLGGPAATALRGVLARWMNARDEVAGQRRS